MVRYLWMSLVSVAFACGPESAGDTETASDGETSSGSETSGGTDGPGDPTESGELEVIRGVYDVQITVVDEGCDDAPRYAGSDQQAIDPQSDGDFGLPLLFGPLSEGVFVVEVHPFEAVAGQPGHYAATTALGPVQGTCGRWRGVLGEIELVEEGRIGLEVPVDWEPGQACPDEENIPGAACTSVLRYDFELVEACPEACEFESSGASPTGGGNQVSCVCP
jgi:hypothetical protein